MAFCDDLASAAGTLHAISHNLDESERDLRAYDLCQNHF